AEIAIDEFQRTDLRVGVVKTAEVVAGGGKLFRLGGGLGGGGGGPIFSGLRPYSPAPAALVGKRVIVVANLKPRQMKFGLSEGMVLAAGGGDRPHPIASFHASSDPPPPGATVRQPAG